MLNDELDLDQELSQIPADYQDTFRRTIEQDLAEAEQNQTDTEILDYLRKQRDNFQQGGFIRPDGRFGAMALDPEAKYEQAWPEIVQDSVGEAENTAERKRTLIKLAAFAGVTLVFLILLFVGNANRDGNPAEDTQTAAASAEDIPTDTAPLPEITGAEDSLQTIGSLGGALTIGRPSAIEIRYRGTEETIALAIDPSRPTPRGELRFNQATMLSDNPVAVWLFGTVLNYAIGIPDSLVRNLEPGDHISLSTDTGASLHFVVAETWQGSNYEAGRLLSQNRLGLTLFALPAAAEEDVSFAFANYDVTGEEGQVQVTYEVGRPFPFGESGEVVVNEVQFTHTTDGNLRIVVSGAVDDLPDSQAIMLSLASSSEQTTAVPISPDEDGVWRAEFILPGRGPTTAFGGGNDSSLLAGSQAVSTLSEGQILLAEFRSLPGGSLAIVQLGQVSNLIEQLEVEITGAWWETAAEQAVVTVSIHNPGEGAVYLAPDFIQFPTEGGDTDAGTWQVTPRLPLLINPGETMGITVSFLPQALMQIGADLWEIIDVPTGRQPANGGG